MCMWFGYNFEIYFCYIFHLVNLSFLTSDFMKVYRDSGYRLSTTHTSYENMHVLSMTFLY